MQKLTKIDLGEFLFSDTQIVAIEEFRTKKMAYAKHCNDSDTLDFYTNASLKDLFITLALTKLYEPEMEMGGADYAN